MSVYELSKNQLIELKQNYLCEVQKNVSYGELCDADNIISDKEIFQTQDRHVTYGHSRLMNRVRPQENIELPLMKPMTLRMKPLPGMKMQESAPMQSLKGTPEGWLNTTTAISQLISCALLS